jgi:hypothetical protein
MRQYLMRFGEEKEDQIEEAEKLDEYEQRECAVNLKQMLYGIDLRSLLLTQH